MELKLSAEYFLSPVEYETPVLDFYAKSFASALMRKDLKFKIFSETFYAVILRSCFKKSKLNPLKYLLLNKNLSKAITHHEWYAIQPC